MSRTHSPDWLVLYEREARQRLTVESVFGELRAARRSGTQLRAACPLHKGRNRSFAINTETLDWICHSKCGEGGGPIQYVHRQRGGTGHPRGREYLEAVEELCRRVNVFPAVERSSALISNEEAVAVWELGRPVTSDPGISRWLRERGLDPELIATHDLARSLAARHVLPRWAGFERDGRWCSWPSVGYRIAVPLFDCRGRLRSMRFRAPRPGAKARPASGVPGTGLVMADSLAQAVLARGEAPTHLQGEQFRVVLAEGEPDFWSWATEPARSGLGVKAQTFPAVLGVVSGSFDDAIAARLPVGTHVISGLHHDKGGDQMNAAIVRKLAAAKRDFTLTRWGAARGEEI